MEWVETTGRTVEQALDAALDELGVAEDDVEYEVLAQPKSGLFGRFGGSEARIRARVKPLSREKPGDRRRRRPAAREERARAEGDGRREPGRSTRSTAASTTPGGERRGAAGQRRRRARDGRRNGGDLSPKEHEGAVMEGEAEIPVEEQAEAASEFTRGLVDAFGAAANVRTEIDDDAVLVAIEGEKLGLLVGPRGTTLHAIEELVRTVVQRQTGGHGARINVDVAGYRARRREALDTFTRQLVQRALETGRDQVLEPMHPADRKVVHDVAAEIDGVETTSEGEEPRRRVVIHPT